MNNLESQMVHLNSRLDGQQSVIEKQLRTVKEVYFWYSIYFRKAYFLLQQHQQQGEEASTILGDKLQQKMDSISFTQERMKRQLDDLQDRTQVMILKLRKTWWWIFLSFIREPQRRYLIWESAWWWDLLRNTPVTYNRSSNLSIFTGYRTRFQSYQQRKKNYRRASRNFRNWRQSHHGPWRNQRCVWNTHT